MIRPQPIEITHLLLQIDDLLIDLLEKLRPQDWERQTLAPKWKVKDVAAHLLDGNLRTLSMLRDSYFGEQPENVDSYPSMVSFLNRLNADWVQAMRRLSPKVLIELLRESGKQYCDYLATLNPAKEAVFSVGWAGEEQSKNWFHIAREYTEKWHHQQQIRYTVGMDKILLQEEWYFPYLDTSIRGLPHHYRNTKGEEGDLIKFTFRGVSDKSWYLYYTSQWELYTAIENTTTCEVTIKDEHAWRIFTKGISREEAIRHSSIKGKQELGLAIFDMIAVMA